MQTRSRANAQAAQADVAEPLPAAAQAHAAAPPDAAADQTAALHARVGHLAAEVRGCKQQLAAMQQQLAAMQSAAAVAHAQPAQPMPMQPAAQQQQLQQQGQQHQQQQQAQQQAQALAVLGPAVLTNGLIFDKLWSLIRSTDREELRLVSRAVCDLAGAAATKLFVGTTDIRVDLARFPDVQSLQLRCTRDNLRYLGAAPLPLGLQELDLRVSGELTDLKLLPPNCAQLRHLHIRNLYKLVSLEGIQTCSRIEQLDMFRCDHVTSIAPLSACVNLKVLVISGCESVTSLEGLQACGQLQELDLHKCRSVQSLAPLSACRHLKRLSIFECFKVTSVEPLEACTQLETLVLETMDDAFRRPAFLAGLGALCAALPLLRFNWV
jgi:hypothetical protein